MCVAATSRCANGVRDGDEAEVDCGGDILGGAAPFGAATDGKRDQWFAACSAGAFVLTSTLAEWTDACATARGAMDLCRVRGRTATAAASCTASDVRPRGSSPADVGVRCCAG